MVSLGDGEQKKVSERIFQVVEVVIMRKLGSFLIFIIKAS